MVICKNKKAYMLGALLLVGCGRPAATSAVKGHFEGNDEQIQEQFEDRQTIVPELRGVPVKSVVVGYPIIETQGLELIQKILATSVEEVIIMVPQSFEAHITGRDVVNSGYHAFIDYEDPSVRDLDLGRVPDGKRIRIIHALRDQQGGEEEQSVWARDWGPIAAKDNATQSLRFLDFNYYPYRRVDDSVTAALEYGYNPDSTAVERVPMPLYFEGGNFAIDNARHCFISTSAVANNAVTYPGFDDGIYDEDDIRSQFSHFGGCDSTQIIPRMPFEGTGHLDMWMKFIDDRNVIIGQIPDVIVNDNRFKSQFYNDPSYLAAFNQVRTYLEDRAQQFRDLNYTVTRIPMPAPMFRWVDDGHGNRSIDGSFRSYTNSVILNNHVLVPLYSAPSRNTHAFAHPQLVRGYYPDASYLRGWTTEVRNIYSRLGLRPDFVASDVLIESGGAVHCATMQIPY